MAHLVGMAALSGWLPRSGSTGRLAIPARLPVLTVGSGAGPGVVPFRLRPAPAAGHAGARTKPRPERASPLHVHPALVGEHLLVDDCAAEQADEERGGRLEVGDDMGHPPEGCRRNRSGAIGPLAALGRVVLGWGTDPGNLLLGQLDHHPGGPLRVD